MDELSRFPGWIGDLLLEDERFGEAYDSTGDLGRSWLKTSIAALFDVYRPEASRSGAMTLEYEAGFGLRCSWRPAGWTLIHLGPGCDSPVRMLAALMPAVCAGVEQVLVSGGGGEFTAPMLAALELAGQEWAANMDDRQAAELVLNTDHAREGRVLALGDPSDMPELSRACLERGTPLKVLDGLCETGVVIGEGRAGAWNLDALALCQGGRTVRVFGDPAGPLPHPLVAGGNDISDDISDDCDVLYRQGGDAGTRALTIGPGGECFWIWPGLDKDFFAVRRFHFHADPGAEG